MQRPRGLAGRRAQLVAQEDTQPLVGRKGLGHLAARRQRLHQQPVAGLAQRRFAHQLRRGPLGAVGMCSAEREPGLRLDLQRAQAQIGDVAADVVHPGVVVTGQEPAAGDGHHRRCRLPRRGRLVAIDRHPGLLGPAARLLDVDLRAIGQRQRKLAAAAQHVTADRLAHLRQQRAQRLVRVRRRTLRPQHPHQLVARHRPLAG